MNASLSNLAPLTRPGLSINRSRLAPGEEWIAGQGGITFVFLLSGVGGYGTRQDPVRLQTGDVLVVNGPDGRIRAACAAPAEFSWFTVGFDHLFPLFSSGELCLLQTVTDAYKRAKIYPAESPVARQCQALLNELPDECDLNHRAQLLRVAGALLAVEFAKARPQRLGANRTEEHLGKVLESLSISELLTMSVSDLARKFGCCRRHLNRLFREHFGVSVGSLKMELRLMKAVSLLRDPEAKVINIAEECGFNHLGLFNTSFKRRFGTSPGQWRKNSLAAAEVRSPVAHASSACDWRVKGLCPWGGEVSVPALNGFGRNHQNVVPGFGFRNTVQNLSSAHDRRSRFQPAVHDEATWTDSTEYEELAAV